MGLFLPANTLILCDMFLDKEWLASAYLLLVAFPPRWMAGWR